MLDTILCFVENSCKKWSRALVFVVRGRALHLVAAFQLALENRKCILYSPLGNSMRSHVLLRLVGGKELWKSMRAASSLCLENRVLIIEILTSILVGRNFLHVSVPLGIGLCWVFLFLKFGDVVVLT